MSENPYESGAVAATRILPRSSVFVAVIVGVTFVVGFASGGFVGYYVGIADGAEHALHKENDATNARWGNAP